MMSKKNKKNPYSERTDPDKIQANWRKTTGLLNRKEWSMAIVRVATTVELTANYVIRIELIDKRKLEPDFVDNLLIWANGITGKLDKLLIPIFNGDPFQRELKDLKKQISDVNKERNSIAHSGQFKKQSTAEKIIKESKTIIETLVNYYDKEFKLKELK